MNDIALRPFEPADLEAVAVWMDDIDASVPASAWLNDACREAETVEAGGRRHRFTSAITDGGTVVGAMLLSIDSWRDARGEIGFVVGEPWRRRGIAVAAIGLQLHRAFNGFGLHRVWAACDPDNPAAVAALTRCGFVVEGRLVEDRLVGSTWRDSLILARVASR